MILRAVRVSCLGLLAGAGLMADPAGLLGVQLRVQDLHRDLGHALGRPGGCGASLVLGEGLKGESWLTRESWPLRLRLSYDRWDGSAKARLDRASNTSLALETGLPLPHEGSGRVYLAGGISADHWALEDRTGRREETTKLGVSTVLGYAFSGGWYLELQCRASSAARRVEVTSTGLALGRRF